MKVRLVVAAVSMALVASACSSTHHSATSSSTASTAGATSSTVPLKKFVVGLLVDVTGPASSGSKLATQGVEAGIAEAKHAGYDISSDLVDTTSTPAGALAGAQKLVDGDGVSAVIVNSAFTFAAASYLTSKRIPVIGVALDGPEWLPASNMFATYSYLVPTRLQTTVGKFLKLVGVSNLGVVAYSIKSSQDAGVSWASSARLAGVTVGYSNYSFPLGSTNVGPVVLGMQSAHVDGFLAPLSPSTTLAILTGLKQQNVALKGSFLSSGYGSDTLQAGEATIQASQGVYFGLAYEPMEMQTAATKRFQAALATIGITTPSSAVYSGYADVALLVGGLQGAGANPTSASLISALSGITNFNAWGLFGDLTVNYTTRTQSGFGVDNCEFVTKLVGSTFQLVPGADPICGDFASS